MNLDLTYSVGLAICALMAIVSALRFKSRGPAALAMALAFVSLGFTIWLLKSHAAQPLIIGGMVVTGILLVADFALRAAKQGSSR